MNMLKKLLLETLDVDDAGKRALKNAVMPQMQLINENPESEDEEAVTE